jgi:hypothetical protein
VVLALPNLPWTLSAATLLVPLFLVLGILGLPLVASVLLRTWWAAVIVPILTLLGAYVGLVYPVHGLDLPRLLDVVGFIKNQPDVVGLLLVALVPIEVAVVVGILLAKGVAKRQQTKI